MNAPNLSTYFSGRLRDNEQVLWQSVDRIDEGNRAHADRYVNVKRRIYALLVSVWVCGFLYALFNRSWEEARNILMSHMMFFAGCFILNWLYFWRIGRLETRRIISEHMTDTIITNQRVLIFGPTSEKSFEHINIAKAEKICDKGASCVHITQAWTGTTAIIARTEVDTVLEMLERGRAAPQGWHTMTLSGVGRYVWRWLFQLKR